MREKRGGVEDHFELIMKRGRNAVTEEQHSAGFSQKLENLGAATARYAALQCARPQ